MGVVRTDEWLNESFSNRVQIEEHILDTVNMREQALIETLNKSGLYKPNRKTNKTFQTMKERKTWSRLSHYYKKYKKEWDGPDIPIFLFPMASEVFTLFRSANKHKSGIAFVDKLFLFITFAANLRLFSLFTGPIPFAICITFIPHFLAKEIRVK